MARYVGRHGESRVAKVILVSAVTRRSCRPTPTAEAPRASVFEGLQAGMAANRSEFFRAVAAGPFYNFDQPGVTPSEPVILNWWRQGMMGSAKAHWDCVSEFINQDWSEDLTKISVPVLARTVTSTRSSRMTRRVRGPSSWCERY